MFFDSFNCCRLENAKSEETQCVVIFTHVVEGKSLLKNQIVPESKGKLSITVNLFVKESYISPYYNDSSLKQK